MKKWTGWLFILLITFHLSCATDENTPGVKPNAVNDTLKHLKVLNYNVRNFNPPSAPENIVNIEPVVDLINGIKPDIISIQEVDVNTRRSGKPTFLCK